MHQSEKSMSLSYFVFSSVSAISWNLWFYFLKTCPRRVGVLNNKNPNNYFLNISVRARYSYSEREIIGLVKLMEVNA